ncbi:MAG: rhomboid family intramembrane serine protease [Akkermansiaceae bacterium]
MRDTPRWAVVFVNFGLSLDAVNSAKVWQLLTHALLHGNWMHLAMNLLMLWLVGARVLHILGTRKWLYIALLSAVGGGVLHLLTEFIVASGHGEARHLVGASGVCIAMLITLTTLSPESRMWPIPVSGKNLGLGILITELIFWLIDPRMGLPVASAIGNQVVLLGGEKLFQYSHACHLGGGLVGWWMARRLLAPSVSLQQLQQMRAEREGTISHTEQG